MIGGVNFTGLRRSESSGCIGVSLEIEVERPQDLVYPIRAIEPIAVIFPLDGRQPVVLSLRRDFPDTPHQNWVPIGMPSALCIDDRPWEEAKLTTTGFEILRRIQIWLSKAAHGKLHDTSQPPEPFFFNTMSKIVLPPNAFDVSTDTIELTGYIRKDNPDLILTSMKELPDYPNTFSVIKLQANPGDISHIRHVPCTLEALALELDKCGISLFEVLERLLKKLGRIRRF